MVQRDEQLAREALREVAPESSVGDATGREVAEDGVVTLTFAATMLGYPGWHWTVSLAEVDGLEPTVLEVELLPGEGALLAPEWVPWSVRLDEYRAAQVAAGAPDESGGAGTGDDDADDDDADDDDLIDDDLGDDDLGDDPDDGIDFESHGAEPGELSDPEVGEGDGSALTDVGVDEQDQPDAEPDEDGPEPPAVVPSEHGR